MIRVGVVSDTHLVATRCSLPPKMLDDFAGTACILHAGDFVDQCVLARLELIAPVLAVYGNCDPPSLSWKLTDRAVIDLQGCRIGLTHGHLGRGATTEARAVSFLHDHLPLHVIVFGHSHVPLNRVSGELLLFNPGSPTQPRRQPCGSYGILELDYGAVRSTIVPLRERSDSHG